MALKVVISDPKVGKSKQIEVADDLVKGLVGKKLGQTVSGKDIGVEEAYQFIITGGSDSAGFPMRRDVNVAGRRTILATSGVGISSDKKGMRVRKTIAGGIVSTQTAQLNMKVSKHGKTPLFEEKPAEKTE